MRLLHQAVVGALVWASASAVLSPSAHAQDAPSLAEQAHRAYEAGELRNALALFDQALRAGGQDSHGLADVYLHLGLLRGIEGNAEAARDAFDVALSIDPSLDRPTEIGPTLGGVFDEVKTSRAGRPLRVSLSMLAGARTDIPPTLEAGVVDSPAGLVRTLRLVLRTPRGDVRVLPDREYFGPQRDIILRLPENHGLPAGTNRLILLALNEFGATVAEASVEVTLPAPVAPAAAPELAVPTPQHETTLPPERREPPRASRSIFASPWFWIGVGVVAAAGGAAAWIVMSPTDRYLFGPPAFVEPTP